MKDAQIKMILKSITVIVDSREQENTHITDYFDRNKIAYVSRKLDYGDYSLICPAIHNSGFNEPVSFEKSIAVERKNSLEELSGNLGQGRERFEREMERAQEDMANLILMVEEGSWEKICTHQYGTDLSEKSFAASLFSFQHRYNLNVQFIPSKLAGWFIYSQMVYFLREELKQMAVVE